MSSNQWWFFHFGALVLGYWLAILPQRISVSDGLKYLCFGLLFGLFILLPGKSERNYDIYYHLQMYPFAAFLVAAGIVVTHQRESMSRKMTEGDLFLLTLSLIYLISPLRLDHRIIACVAAIPSLIVLFFAFTKASPSQGFQLFLGIWSLLLTGIFCVEQIAPSISMLHSAHHNTWWEFGDYLDLFGAMALAGATCVFLASSLLPLFALMRNKHEERYEWKRRLREEELPFLRGRVFARDIPTKIILFITLVHGGPLLLNYNFEFASYPLVMGYALLVSPPLTFALANRMYSER